MNLILQAQSHKLCHRHVQQQVQDRIQPHHSHQARAELALILCKALRATCWQICLLRSTLRVAHRCLKCPWITSMGPIGACNLSKSKDCASSRSPHPGPSRTSQSSRNSSLPSNPPLFQSSESRQWCHWATLIRSTQRNYENWLKRPKWRKEQSRKCIIKWSIASRCTRRS